MPEGELPSRPWQAVCDLDAIPAQAGIGARLGSGRCPDDGERVYALDNRPSRAARPTCCRVGC
ncbi:hypothetical protein MJ561_17890 [Klebsiella pneumoniae]|nr:hypothetical protein MJ561_17890 [Klebsiella pneumoniae]